MEENPVVWNRTASVRRWCWVRVHRKCRSMPRMIVRIHRRQRLRQVRFLSRAKARSSEVKTFFWTCFRRDGQTFEKTATNRFRRKIENIREQSDDRNQAVRRDQDLSLAWLASHQQREQGKISFTASKRKHVADERWLVSASQNSLSTDSWGNRSPVSTIQIEQA